MSPLKSVYNVFRSIIMSVIVLLVIVYVGLYVVLSVPAVQEKARSVVCAELSNVLGGTLDIDDLKVSPFSEVVLTDVRLLSPEGRECASIGKIAAGIDLWSLFADRRVVINYAEIIGFDVRIVQLEKGGPLNIAFLIEALSPKDRTKPSALYNVRIRNVVVRGSKASFRRPWLAEESDGRNPLADIAVSRLRMDLSIPAIRNDMYRFDVRNIQFDASPGVSVRRMSADVAYVRDPGNPDADRLLIRDFSIGLPNSSLEVGDVDLNLKSLSDIEGRLSGRLTPADFSAFLPRLRQFDSPWMVELDAFIRGRDLTLESFCLEHKASGSSLGLQGEVHDLTVRDSLSVILRKLKADVAPQLVSETLAAFPEVGGKVRRSLASLGRVVIESEGSFQVRGSGNLKGTVASSVGSLEFDASATGLGCKRPHVALNVEVEGLEAGKLIGSDRVGRFSGIVSADVHGMDADAEGRITLTSDECVVMGNRFTELNLTLDKEKRDIDLELDLAGAGMSVSLDGQGMLAGAESRIDADMMLSGLNPSDFGMKGKLADCDLSARISATATGNSLDNVIGRISLSEVSMTKADGKKLALSEFTLSVDTLRNGIPPQGADHKYAMARDVRIDCDWLDARLTGIIRPSTVVKEMKGMVGSVFPTLVYSSGELKDVVVSDDNDFTFGFTLKGVAAPYAFFGIPLRPLTDIPVRGSVDSPGGKAHLEIATPYLQQGKNKLMRDIALNVDLDSYLGMGKASAGLIFPAKKGDAELQAEIYAARDKVSVNLDINPTLESVVKGGVALAASFSRRPDPFHHAGALDVRLDVLPSSISVNDKVWLIADGSMDYSGKRISIRNFLISHDDQYVMIDGTASEDPADIVKVKLNDIDLEYIFNILNINYVTFGGMASGEVVGGALLTKAPQARTEFLRVKGLSYNGAVIGDGDIASDYDAVGQKVGIFAVVRDPLTRERRASIDGGIWVTRDSLSFGFDAKRVNVGIMKPFVSAFCSDLYGEASGKCRLFGTFSDIDLNGELKADTLSMKLDFTNTWYHAGGDSVYLKKGLIEIPPLTLYDDEKHTAEFSGWLRHRYFHEPEFGFRLRDARSLLCYDTNEKMNPLWYGTIYGSGHAQINGRPGLIDIDMNMTTEEGSKFYYIISDADDVAQYSFLTFTDRRKERQESMVTDTVPEYLKKFRKETEEAEDVASNVMLSVKGTVTNDALVTLVMDPRAGDNITARGRGALQMDYNLASNDLRMIGTYVLDEGNYNFTLQDIIIRNFSIRKGSQIKFDGDPMKAMLDIAATYRVNTNLTDLDKSFSTDKELNRTNVPVDAVLLVDGPMTNPDITFDIELPSLTSDVERKVKSIVSTNDMMSRQIIYLLALNRFYTPEYTGGQSNGSEWSSMASSTISSQLSNILSQMTDKLDVAPSFRSEKGDFTDMEFDLALSSRLLNNRLLINGNFGYRDRSTSNTQFVGDFDIEYLLSKNGNLRLKAYNHFNDQNYYLRSALTTQGVGVVFRRDFDRLFRRRKDDGRGIPQVEANDSLPVSVAGVPDGKEAKTATDNENNK